MTRTVPSNAIDRIVNIDDIEKLALARLDPAVAAYLLGGAGDEVSLQGNRVAFDHYRLLPRISEGKPVSLTTTLLGREVSMPIGIAPSAAHGLFTERGELATAEAARSANALYCVSSASTCSLEDIAATAGPWWYQCYPASGATGLGRASELGYDALVLTVDVPVAGHRDREFRSERANPAHAMYASTWQYAKPDFDLGAHSARTRVTWADIDRIIAGADVPVVLKGILATSDAIRAREAGAAAVWVSNHGARQLDRAIAPLDALPGIVDAVGDTVEVYVDGGLRRGTDAAIALALGARAVFVGRAPLFGLSAAGSHGAAVVLSQLRRELDNAVALLGAQSTSSLDRSFLTRVGNA